MSKLIKNRFLRILLRIFLGIFVFLALVILFIRSPWGQNIIVGKAVNFLKDKTETEVSIDRLYLTFGGNLSLEGLYVEDLKQDTLLYSNDLEVSLALVPLIKGTEINIKSVKWQGLRAKVSRPSESESFNFQFLIDAFATPTDTTTTSSTSSPELEIGDIQLGQFNVDFNDGFVGMNASLQLGELNFEVKKLDLEQMIYAVDELSISNTQIEYELTKAAQITETSTEESAETQLPQISVGKLKLEKVNLDYKSHPDQTFALANIGLLQLDLPQADLNSQKIVLDELVFNNSKVVFRQIPSEQVAVPTDSTASTEFVWPDWNVEAKSISLQNNQVELQTANTYLEAGVFNAEWLQFRQLNFEAEDISLKPNQAHLALHELAFQERSGLNIRKTNFNLDVDQKHIALKNLDFESKSNLLSGNVQLEFNSLNSFLNAPDSASVNINLDELKVDLEEASVFSPDIKKNEYVKALSKKELSGKINIEGKLNDLDISTIQLNWGKTTAVNLVGKIQHVLEPEILSANIPKLSFSATKSDLSAFVNPDSMGVEFPEKVDLKGSFQGGLNDAKTQLQLKTTSGNIDLNGLFQQKETLAFQANIKAEEIQLNKLLQNDQLDTLSFSMNLEGSGKNLNELNAKLSTDFERLKYNGYDFSNLELQGDITNGNGEVDLKFKDENLDMEMTTLVELDSVAPKIDNTLTVRGADLLALGLTVEDVRTAFVMKTTFAGNASNFDLETHLDDAIAIYNLEAYNFGDFNLKAVSSPDTTHVNIQSQMLDSKINSNKGIQEIIPLFQQEVERYLGTLSQQKLDTMQTNTKVDAKLVVRQSPLISKVFFQSLERMDSISLKMNFDSDSSYLSAELLAPYIQYEGSSVDSLGLKLNGRGDSLNFLLGWSGIEAGPISVDDTKLNGKVNKGLITSHFRVINRNELLLNIGSEVRLGDTLMVHVLPDSLIFDSNPWRIPSENQLVMAGEYLNIESFELSNESQKLTVGTNLSGQEKEHVGAVFSNFHLSTITSLLNPDKPLADGTLNGEVVLENPFGNFGMVADLDVSELSTMNIPLGKLTLKAQAAGSQKYEANMTVKGENLDLDVSGSYLASAEGGDISLNMDINRLKMLVIEELSNNTISETEGNLAASVEVSGNMNDPQYSGTLDFNQVSLLVNELNTKFAISQEQLEINNDGLFLNNFQITDEDNNDFNLDGKILTESLVNPSFDLKLTANNFGVINSTEEDSELFYGQVNLDADLTITGDLTIPKVRGSLAVNEGSELTFTVPESQLELKEREGVVVFVNKKNPDDILTRVEEEKASGFGASLSGYDIETVFSIGENSQFNIIIDKSTGDNLQVTGTGDFNLSIEPNGRTSLSGKYELSGGHYEASLFNLVTRRFDIASGSTISWSGDPYDAKLEVRAVYEVKTSAGPLMATRTSAENTGIETSYQERLPFQVYINVNGQLLKPEISFTLDMPEDDRSALSGAVYGQVQQLNGQEEELNKQVFSLLVLNRFFPSSGSDGSNGGPASLALDNVNKVLSSQLNTYSDKIFGSAVDVGFNLNSTAGNDSNGGQAQTQLGITAKKQLFNDRLIIQVGSEVDVAGNQNASQGAPIIGNVSLEYLLTEDKRLRLKGFSRNKYEGVIDGQLTVSGIALIFTREFNKLKELWTKQVKEEVEKEKDDKENEEK